MSETTVEIRGSKILVDGEESLLYGFRVPSAPLTERWTDELVGELDRWAANGVNAIHLWIQGSSGGYIEAFDSNGHVRDDPEDIVVVAGYGGDVNRVSIGQVSCETVLERSQRIVAEAAKRGIVVLIGFFYNHAVRKSGMSTEALATAAGEAAARFADSPNVVFNVWNEPLVDDDHQSVDELRRYMRAVKDAAPDRPVGTGYEETEMNHELVHHDELDVILYDAGREVDRAIDGFRTLETYGKPIVNVETFKNWGNGVVDDPTKSAPAPEGYYIDFDGWRRVYGAWEDEDYQLGTGGTTCGRNSYERIVDFVAEEGDGQYHVLAHVGGWFQGASRVERPEQVGSWQTNGEWDNTFHRGYDRGRGTIEDPGIGWLLDAFDRNKEEHR